MDIGGGADKPLTRPGRKQATATKLAIYSTYSPRSPIHFLTRCSNICKPLKKIQTRFRPTRSPLQQLIPRRTRNGELSIVFFQSREQVEVRRGRIRRIGWVINTLEVQVCQFLLGCKCPVKKYKNKTPPWWSSRGVFPSKCPSIATAETSNTPRWYFGPSEDNQWEGCCLDPKTHRGENFSSGFLHSELFRTGWAAKPPLHWFLLSLRVIVI